MSTTITESQIIHDDALRAAYLMGREHAYADAYGDGYSACWIEYRDRWNDRLEDVARDGCAHLHPAIADSVARMFPTFTGADLAHAQSVQNFRRGIGNSSPRCDCGDWAVGYAYRDAMARYGGVLEAEAAGLDFNTIRTEHRKGVAA